MKARFGQPALQQLGLDSLADGKDATGRSHAGNTGNRLDRRRHAGTDNQRLVKVIKLRGRWRF